MLTPEQMLDETRMQKRVRRSKIAQHLVINGVDAEGVLIYALRNAKIELKRGDHDVETMIGMAMNAGITDDEVEKARRHFRKTMDLTKVSKAPIRDKNTGMLDYGAVEAAFHDIMRLHHAFAWADSPQGCEFWRRQVERGVLDPEARVILQATLDLRYKTPGTQQ